MSNRVRRILIRRALAFLAATTLVVAAGWTASTAGAETGITIFVSPAGDDANPGTETLPIRTLTRARDLVRTMNASLTADLTVRLADGTYRLAAPLALSALDSGSGGHRVVWTAAPGAHPVVSGGVRVTGWTLTDATRNLWSASAPAVLANTRQLYVDGHRAARAAGRLPVSLTQTTTGYTASADTMSRWRSRAGTTPPNARTTTSAAATSGRRSTWRTRSSCWTSRVSGTSTAAPAGSTTFPAPERAWAPPTSRRRSWRRCCPARVPPPACCTTLPSPASSSPMPPGCCPVPAKASRRSRRTTRSPAPEPTPPRGCANLWRAAHVRSGRGARFTTTYGSPTPVVSSSSTTCSHISVAPGPASATACRTAS